MKTWKIYLMVALVAVLCTAAVNLTMQHQALKITWTELAKNGTGYTADYGAFFNGTAIINWQDAYNSTDTSTPQRWYWYLNADGGAPDYSNLTFTNSIATINGNATQRKAWTNGALEGVK